MLRQPWLWSSKTAIEAIAAYSDSLKRRYGASFSIPADLLPQPRADVTAFRASMSGSSMPDVIYLEYAYAW